MSGSLGVELQSILLCQHQPIWRGDWLKNPIYFKFIELAWYSIHIRCWLPFRIQKGQSRVPSENFEFQHRSGSIPPSWIPFDRQMASFICKRSPLQEYFKKTKFRFTFIKNSPHVVDTSQYELLCPQFAFRADRDAPLNFEPIDSGGFRAPGQFVARTEWIQMHSFESLHFLLTDAKWTPTFSSPIAFHLSDL